MRLSIDVVGESVLVQIKFYSYKTQQSSSYSDFQSPESYQQNALTVYIQVYYKS